VHDEPLGEQSTQRLPQWNSTDREFAGQGVLVELLARGEHAGEDPVADLKVGPLLFVEWGVLEYPNCHGRIPFFEAPPLRHVLAIS